MADRSSGEDAVRSIQVRVALISVIGALVGALIGAGSSFYVVHSQQNNDDAQAAQSAFYHRAASFITSSDQLGVLAATKTGGANTAKMDQIQIQAQSEYDVMLFNLKNQKIAKAAYKPAGITISTVIRAAEGERDDSSQHEIIAAIKQLDLAINPSVKINVKPVT